MAIPGFFTLKWGVSFSTYCGGLTLASAPRPLLP
jgi:hypothetical protein